MGWSTRRTVTLVVAALIAVAALVAVRPTAPAASASDHGASFAVRCPFSHRLSDDPIVQPGKRGAAHSHYFFGNTSTKFNSTYGRMIAAPTTCTRDMDNADYWMPTLSWGGEVHTSNRVVFYYRAARTTRGSIPSPPV